MGELYIWLVQHFPYDEDPKHDDAYYVTPRDEIGHWRDALLRHLQDRGTYAACDAIRRIAQALPQVPWLRDVLLRAEAAARRETWVPARPEEILRLADDPARRLVQSGDQLLDVLAESLKRLEHELQGETPTATFLWNKIDGGLWRPKDERDFADYVKIHLDRDLKKRGIILNREVEIHRPAGAPTGERTDIHVNAVLKRSSGEELDTVAVIMEVKGSWHQELKTAMETQLVEQYLKDNHCQHGLYLVGWFYSDERWDDSDKRKRRVPRLTLSEAQAQFDTQANELSKEGKRIRAIVIDTTPHRAKG